MNLIQPSQRLIKNIPFKLDQNLLCSRVHSEDMCSLAELVLCGTHSTVLSYRLLDPVTVEADLNILKKKISMSSKSI